MDEELHVLHQLHSSIVAPFHSSRRLELRHLASWKQEPKKPLAWVFYPGPGAFLYFSRRSLLGCMPQQGAFSERTENPGTGAGATRLALWPATS